MIPTLLAPGESEGTAHFLAEAVFSVGEVSLAVHEKGFGIRYRPPWP